MPQQEKPEQKQQSFRFLPLTLCIETLGGVATPLVLRGTPLPALRTQVFSTASDNQTAVAIRVLMGESPIAKRNVHVGTFTFSGIPKAPRGKPEIAVRFEVDQSCAIKASASETKSNKEVSVQIEGTQPELTKESIQRLLQQALTTREEDEKQLKLIEATNKANQLMREAEARLRAVKDKGWNMGFDKKTDRLLAELGLAMQSKDAQMIRTKAEELDKLLHDPSGFDFEGIFTGNDVFSSFFGSPKQKAAGSTRVSAKTGKDDKPITKTQVPPSAPEHAGMVASHPPSSRVGKVFGGGEFSLDSKLAFVLMPFKENLRPIYKDHIRPVVESEGLFCLRADEIAGTGLITWDVWEKINRARFLIADLTGKNPNVFYEVGLAHALGKDVILLTQDLKDVPFDLKSLRCIVYSYTPPGMKNMESKLRETIRHLMKSS
jgi:hypothetical protein